MPLTAVPLDVAYSRLSLDEIADQHGVSLSAVREGITCLAPEDVVEAPPQRDLRVRSLSLDHLHDLTWMRIQLETLALRRSLARGHSSWDPDLVAARHSLTVTPMCFDDGVRLTSRWAEIGDLR